jgi:hypothetical protein
LARLWIVWNGFPAARAFWILAGLHIVAAAVALVYLRADVADYYPTNGDFQSFNPVRRLFAGQRLGRDFQAYLGLAPTYGMLLAMVPLGRTFTDSIAAGLLLHVTVNALSYIVLVRVAGGSLTLGLCLAALGIAMGMAVSANQPIWLVDSIPEARFFLYAMTFAENSMFSLRAFGPILAAVAFAGSSAWIGRRPQRPPRRIMLLLGATAGPLLLWSPDSGIPSWIGFLTASLLFCRTPRSWPERLRCVGTFCVASAATSLPLLLMLTGGNPLLWAHYHFVDVAFSQRWYYQGYSSKALTLSVLPWIWFAPGALVVVALLAARRRFSVGPALTVTVASVLAALMTTIGLGISYRYAFPVWRCSGILAWVALVRALAALLRPMPATARRCLLAMGYLAVLLPASFLIVRSAHELARWRNTLGPRLHVPELGGTLESGRYDKLVAVAREIGVEADRTGRAPEQRLFSTYATAADVIAGATQPTGHDYIIHALGEDNDRKYARTFAQLRPLNVQTLRPDRIMWEGWLQQMHWRFYRQLFREYAPSERTSEHVFWRRRDAPVEPIARRGECSVTQPHAAQADLYLHVADAPLHDEDSVLLDVRLRYETAALPGAFLRGLLTQHLVRFPAGAHSWTEEAGMPNGPRSASFPVRVSGAERKVVRLELRPLEHSRLRVLDCDVTALWPVVDQTEFRLARLIAHARTDDAWDRGIHRSEPRMVVSDESDLANILPGMWLDFAGSGHRRVVQIEGPVVAVDGGPLDPQQDGYPARIGVVATDLQ